jgi:hypothetical protein
MNLAGIVVPGQRIAAVPGRQMRFRNGVLIPDEADNAATTWRPAEQVVEAPAVRLFL